MTTTTRPNRAHPGSNANTKLFEDFEAQPLPLDRLVKIWKSLPENERLRFVLALEERIAAQMMLATMPRAPERKDV